MVRKYASIVALFLLIQWAITAEQALATFDSLMEKEETVVSPGVTHIQEKYQSSDSKEVVNVLDVQLKNTYTKLELGLPSAITKLQTTSALAKANNFAGHRVVGATNASYFLGNGSPANLLAQNNEIINYGVLGENADSPTQQAVAFGISKTGAAIADYYTANLTFTINGKTYTIDRINNERAVDKTVLYTADVASTNTNQWGVEVVVTDATQDTKTLHFGDRFTGTIASVTKYGAPGNSAVPDNGFVLSIQNKALATELATVAPGTPVEVSLAIDEKWMDAQFILAAGPLLVKDGKVNISMPASSSFATGRSDRTAVAVDATGKRIFLVTVDGRQSGYSNGTSLKDLAAYLISKGATAAINLDGGGSTTMVVRAPGGYEPMLVNKPSDGAERRVSTILQIINTAQPGAVKFLKLGGLSGEVLKDSSIKITVARAYDEYLNPITVDPAKLTWSVEGGVGKMEGNVFTATTQGTGKIIGTYNGVRAELAVKVVNALDGAVLLNSFDQASQWTVSTAKAVVSIANQSSYEPYRQGASSLKLNYDFTTAETGTKAVYAVAKAPMAITGLPKNIGVWVYGDAAKHWLRGIIVDGAGTKHTIDFTAQGGLNWSGWKYVKADVPQNIQQPLKFERIYITQPVASLQNKGVIYFDQLQAVYSDKHVELAYTDVPTKYWAYSAIQKLNASELVKGYVNGTYQPENTITRGEAAVIIARALNLQNTKKITFADVSTNHYAYASIAAVAEKGIITGRTAEKFSPDGKLTRAEMAAILTRAYKLTGTAALPFKDVNNSHWAYSYVQALYANKITKGYPDNTFKLDKQLNRAEFAALLAAL